MIYIIEGDDGVGKSTLINNIKAKGDANFTFYREPGSTEFGERCREILLDDVSSNITQEAQIMLVMAARIELYKIIHEDIKNGKTVIVDRGLLSTYMYQYEVLHSNNSEVYKNLLFSVHPDNINVCILFLQGPSHDISARDDNNWLDNININKTINVDMFISDILNKKNFYLNKISTEHKDEVEVCNEVYKLINN